MGNSILEQIKKRKFIIIFTLIYVIVSVGIVKVVINDAFLYKQTVVKVTSQKKIGSYKQKSQNQKSEKYYTQRIKGIVQNGELKGKKVKLVNDYSKSRVKTDKYVKGDYVFASVSKDDNTPGTVNGMKRDYIVCIIVLIFMYCMIMVSRTKGLLFIISSAVNISILYGALELYSRGTDILMLSYLMVIAFTCITLACISGINRATIISIISVLSVVTLTGIIYKIALMYTDAPDYIMMEYVTGPNDLEKLFFAEILMGCLGAVMDIAVSVSETSCALIKQNANLALTDFKASMKALGQDVMGTMINIMFYSYFCSSVPMVIIQMKNKYKMNYIFRFDLPFELTRFLTGAISIVLTIPVTAFVAWIILYYRNKHKNSSTITVQNKELQTEDIGSEE